MYLALTASSLLNVIALFIAGIYTGILVKEKPYEPKKKNYTIVIGVFWGVFAITLLSIGLIKPSLLAMYAMLIPIGAFVSSMIFLGALGLDSNDPSKPAQVRDSGIAMGVLLALSLFMAASIYFTNKNQ